MEKIDICLVQTGHINFINNIKYLNPDKYIVRFAIMDIMGQSEMKIETSKGTMICQAFPFFMIEKAVFSFGKSSTKYFLCGCENELSETLSVRNILSAYGISKENVYNFGFWDEGLKNYTHIVQYAISKPFDFLVTGISYMECGLDIECFPLSGINLAQSGQDIFYGYNMAKYVLEENSKNCKFAVIGLAPYSFEYDSSLAFSSSFYPLYYYPFFRDFKNTYSPKNLLTDILDEKEYDRLLSLADEEKADLNRNFIKKNHLGKTFARKDVLNVLKEESSLSGKNYPNTVAENISIMEEYLDLLNYYKIKPVFCIMPFSKLLRTFYDSKKINEFRAIVDSFKEKYNICIIDLWDFDIENKYFYDVSHLNGDGAKIVSKFICKRLRQMKVSS